jgi:hypothetical protein
MGGKDPKKESCAPEYIYTTKTEILKHGVVNHKRVLCTTFLKNLETKITKEQAEILFNFYANLSLK